MRVVLYVLVACLLCSACGYAEVQQSSLVPLPTMSPPSSLSGQGDVYLGDSVVTYVGARELRPNGNAGLWLPRHQLDGAASMRLSRFFSLRLLGGVGLPDDATAAAPTTLELPGRPTLYGGFGNMFHYLDPSGVGFDLEIDTMVAMVPSRMRSRYCPGDGTCGEWSAVHSGSDNVPLLGGTARVFYVAADWITIYGGATVRNHPTNTAAFSATVERSSVSMGGAVLVVGLGAELTIARVLSFIPHITWPVYGGPVAYGPMIGLAIRVHVGEGPGDRLPPWSAEPEEEATAPPVPAPEPEVTATPLPAASPPPPPAAGVAIPPSFGPSRPLWMR